MRNFPVTYCGTRCVVCFLVLICSRHAQAGDVLVLGSADGTATNGLPQVGTSFLLNEVHQTGVLFAISAYFVERTNVSFQIWRPTDDPSATSGQAAKRFKLIWQLTATPSIAKNREDIYMEAKFLSACALVRPGDWVGVVHLTAPAAIGALFTQRSDPMPKMNEETDGNGQAIGLIATFEMNFIYPYNLLVAAYIFSDPMLVNASGLEKSETTLCPTDLLVPSWTNTNSTTPVPMVTYPPGATGATGETGQRGPDGAPGIPGAPGPLGEDGAIGQPGSSGMQGATGPIGATGLPGTQGQKGPLGSSGLSSVGTQGDTGAPGPQGPPGNDTYHYEFLPDAQPVQSDDLQSDGGLADRTELRMGVIIWLAILSAIVVFSALMLVFVCYFIADDRRVQKNEAAWIEPEK